MRNAVLISVGLLVTACAPVLMFATQGPPSTGGVGLVISKPWKRSARSIVASSNLHEVGPIQGRFGVFVMIETNESVQTLYTNGAWFVVDGQKIMELCVS